MVLILLHSHFYDQMFGVKGDCNILTNDKWEAVNKVGVNLLFDSISLIKHLSSEKLFC